MVYSDLKEMFTDAKNLATGANDLQLKSVLLDIQDAVYDLQEENRDLRLEIHELKNNNILEGELEYRNGVYTKGNDVFCAVCWDSSKKLIRVRKAGQSTSGTTNFFCEICKQRKITDIPWGK
ncbi:hypothetical protein [Enterococcus hirae]|uniref:hypothetical protein n=1 Tax=Enterococcus hirae TaxID=1354 RepID=UPI001A96398E|nr:hypothetical protein [Enterococcus hirae]EMF0042529.1 hypothetical protein [Enterococcus hirae]MBO1092038.1 hypothetical protein [Enterococcus hirae]